MNIIQTNDCPLCQKVLLCQQKKFPLLIHEFNHSYLILGDHQFYKGYSQIIFKEHQRELHDLPTSIRKELFEELMQAGRAVANAFNPLKMNYASYGNIVEHIHWHIFPRYEDDPRKKDDPFSNSHEFSKFSTIPETAIKTIHSIRQFI